MKKEVIRKILIELWPFLLRFSLNCGFRSIIFEGKATISFKVYSKVKHYKIQVVLNMEVIRKILTELWPFFDLGLG